MTGWERSSDLKHNNPNSQLSSYELSNINILLFIRQLVHVKESEFIAFDFKWNLRSLMIGKDSAICLSFMNGFGWQANGLECIKERTDIDSIVSQGLIDLENYEREEVIITWIISSENWSSCFRCWKNLLICLNKKRLSSLSSNFWKRTLYLIHIQKIWNFK